MPGFRAVQFWDRNLRTTYDSISELPFLSQNYTSEMLIEVLKCYLQFWDEQFWFWFCYLRIIFSSEISFSELEFWDNGYLRTNVTDTSLVLKMSARLNFLIFGEKWFYQIAEQLAFGLQQFIRLKSTPWIIHIQVSCLQFLSSNPTVSC